MLRYSIVVLSIVVSIIAKAQYNPYFYDNPYPSYPVYPAGYKNSAPGYYYPKESRLFFNLLISTSTSTTTCTISTVACSGKRKRFVIGDVEDDSAIQPSTVNQVETTPVVEMGSRMEREAYAQFAHVRGSPQSNYPYYDVEPTFGGNYFAYSSPEQFYNRPPINAADPADPRFGFYFSTTTTTTTVSSTPGCSFASSFNKC